MNRSEFLEGLRPPETLHSPVTSQQLQVLILDAIVEVSPHFLAVEIA